MLFAITSILLIVCGIVNAVHHDENQGLPDYRMKSKRSVYGFNIPIEPYERKLDFHVDAYQPAGYWPYQQNSIQHWEIPATFPESTAVKPDNRVHEYLVSAPESDVVYRTLMQRAAAASTAADVPDRGGNVAIQLTANLVYGYQQSGYQPSGYQPSDVDEPVVTYPKTVHGSKFGVPFFDDLLQKPVVVPKKSANIEPAVIIVALSSSDSSEIKDTITRDVDVYDKFLTDYHKLNQISSHDESSFATAATTSEDPFMVIYNILMQQMTSKSASKATTVAESESSDRTATTTTEVNPAENEIDAAFYTEPTTATSDNKLECQTIYEYGNENIVCAETIETVTKVEVSNENESEDVLLSTIDSGLSTIETLLEVVDDEDNKVEWSVTTEDLMTSTQAEEDENKNENDSNDGIDNERDDSQPTITTENVQEITSTIRQMEENESWNIATESEPVKVDDEDNKFEWSVMTEETTTTTQAEEDEDKDKNDSNGDMYNVPEILSSTLSNEKNEFNYIIYSSEDSLESY